MQNSMAVTTATSRQDLPAITDRFSTHGQMTMLPEVSGGM